MVSNKDPLLSPMLKATSMLISERYSFLQLYDPIVQSYARRDQCLWRAKGLYAPQFGRYLHHRNGLSQWTQRTAQRQVVCDCSIHRPSRMPSPSPTNPQGSYTFKYYSKLENGDDYFCVGASFNLQCYSLEQNIAFYIFFLFKIDT